MIMALTIVTFANLGKKKNLKTPDIAPVIDAFIAHGELKQLVCQVDDNFAFPATVSATPKVVRYSLRTLERIFGITLVPRGSMESIFDFFASRLLQPADATLIHPALFRRTLETAKKKNSTAIGVLGAAHPRFAERLYEQELAALDVPPRTYSEATPEKLVSGQFDYLLAMSDFVKQTHVEEKYPSERIFLATPDIDLERFTVRGSQRNTDIFTVVYAGYTTPLKGLQYLLDAWKELKLSNAELVLLGGWGDMPEELKERYDRLIAADSTIKWIGNTSTPEQFYREADVFVFPSLTEGFGRVTLEAMACGVPVITTQNARGIVEGGKTGFVVPIRDSNTIAQKLRYLYENRDIARQMGVDARKAVENKKPFGEAVYEIYQEIMRREKKL